MSFFLTVSGGVCKSQWRRVGLSCCKSLDRINPGLMKMPNLTFLSAQTMLSFNPYPANVENKVSS